MTDQPQVQPNLKPVGECGCGCGQTGTFRVKPDGRGVLHTRNCDKAACASCRNRRNKREGGRHQAQTARALGIPSTTLHPGHEELSLGSVRWEHKSGKQASPVITRFRLSRAQSEAQRPHGDNRPFVATFSHDGLKVACIDLTDLREAVAALAEQLGIVA